MPLTLQQTVAPTDEVWDLHEVKALLRIDTSDEDALLFAMLQAGIAYVETVTDRQLLPATWKLYLDAFATEIRLPRPPTTSITSVEYLDTAGNLQTLATTEYQTDLVSEPARIRLAEGKSWPSVQADTLNVVHITYVSGYADADNVPQPLRQAVSMIVGDLYEHREARLDLAGALRNIVDNPTIDRLLWLYRVVPI